MSAPYLIFLPCLEGPHPTADQHPMGNFAPIAAAAEGNGFRFRLVTPDWSRLTAPGFFAHCTELLDQAIQSLGDQPFWLAGHSFGAHMAIRYAIKSTNTYTHANPSFKGVLAFSAAPLFGETLKMFLACYEHKLYSTDFGRYPEAFTNELMPVSTIQPWGDQMTIHLVVGERELPLNHLMAWELTGYGWTTFDTIRGAAHSIASPGYIDGVSEALRLAKQAQLEQQRGPGLGKNRFRFTVH